MMYTNQQMPTQIQQINTNGKSKIILPELSYTIVGALFEVSNEMGSGFQEKYYYCAVQKSLEKRGLKVRAQVHMPVEFGGSNIGKYFIDFLVNDQIVLELKIGARFRKMDFEQVKAYLRIASKPLGILARFSPDGVTFHRVFPPQ